MSEIERLKELLLKTDARLSEDGNEDGKSVRQRNVRQDNTNDRAGTLPLNLYEAETILNPLNLRLVTELGYNLTSLSHLTMR